MSSLPLERYQMILFSFNNNYNSKKQFHMLLVFFTVTGQVVPIAFLMFWLPRRGWG